jgi:bifunctional non-homologous end joining protein LigD
VALDDSARPQFNLLQNYRGDASRIRYFVFGVLCYQNRDTTALPLVERRRLVRSLLFRSPRTQSVDYFETSVANMVAAAEKQRLEGVIAKRRDSLCQPGRRTGSWVKYRISVGQEFVVGGYFPGPHGFDSIIGSGLQVASVFKIEASRDFYARPFGPSSIPPTSPVSMRRLTRHSPRDEVTC